MTWWTNCESIAGGTLRHPQTRNKIEATISHQQRCAQQATFKLVMLLATSYNQSQAPCKTPATVFIGLVWGRETMCLFSPWNKGVSPIVSLKPIQRMPKNRMIEVSLVHPQDPPLFLGGKDPMNLRLKPWFLRPKIKGGSPIAGALHLSPTFFGFPSPWISWGSQASHSSDSWGYPRYYNVHIYIYTHL